jgi:hypothetical protein
MSDYTEEITLFELLPEEPQPDQKAVLKTPAALAILSALELGYGFKYGSMPVLIGSIVTSGITIDMMLRISFTDKTRL